MLKCMNKLNTILLFYFSHTALLENILIDIRLASSLSSNPLAFLSPESFGSYAGFFNRTYLFNFFSILVCFLISLVDYRLLSLLIWLFFHVFCLLPLCRLNTLEKYVAI